jgi:hypothetical protein
MIVNKIGWLFRFFITLSLFVSLLMFGCRTPFVAPTAIELEEPPLEVTVNQIYQEYQDNIAAANAKYIGKHLLFRNLEVEDIFIRQYNDRHGYVSYVKEYLRCGIIRFILRDFYVTQQYIEVGFVLNVVGYCEGFSVERGMVVISDCWVQAVKGDLNLSGPGWVAY